MDDLSSLLRYARTPLPSRPRLVPWVVPVDLGDGRLQLRSAESALTIRFAFLADVFGRVAPLLDGSRGVDELAAGGGEGVEPTTVVFLLKLLRTHGLLQESVAPDDVSPDELELWEPQLRFLAHFVPDPLPLQAALAAARISVLGGGPLAAATLARLRALGVRAPLDLGDELPDGDGTELLLVALDRPRHALLERVNAVCLERGLRWLHVVVGATKARLGPTVVPGHTACYVCLDRRLRSNARELDGLDASRAQAPEPPDEGMLEPFRALVAAQAALEAARLVTGFAPPVTLGRSVELDSRTPTATVEDVLRVPRCPACSRSAPAAEVWDRTLARLEETR